MKVKELIEQLQKVDPEMDVYYKRNFDLGNVALVVHADIEPVSFFGSADDCMVLDSYNDKDE